MWFSELVELFQVKSDWCTATSITSLAIGSKSSLIQPNIAFPFFKSSIRLLAHIQLVLHYVKPWDSDEPCLRKFSLEV